MSQPANSVIVAPSRSCTARSGVSRTVEVTCLILAVTGYGRLDMATLTSEQVASELAATPGWPVSDGQLTRTVTRKDFRDALLFVNAVGFLAGGPDRRARTLPVPGTAARWPRPLVTQCAAVSTTSAARCGPASPSTCSRWRRG